MKAARRFTRLTPLFWLLIMAWVTWMEYPIYQPISVSEFVEKFELDKAEPYQPKEVNLARIGDRVNPRASEGYTYYCCRDRERGRSINYCLEIPNSEEPEDWATANLPEYVDVQVIVVDYGNSYNFLYTRSALALIFLLFLTWLIALFNLFAQDFKNPSQRWFWLVGLLLFSLILAPMFPFAARNQVVPKGGES